jgi:hypothetical protein
VCEYPEKRNRQSLDYASPCKKKDFHEQTAGPQISPLRCASVEMTKGKAALPGRVVAEQEPFCITLGGRSRTMTPPGRKQSCKHTARL